MPDYADLSAFDKEALEQAKRMLNPHGGMYWILCGREVIPTDDVLEWGKWFSEDGEDRVIERSDVRSPGGGVCWVSTVFMGLDMSLGLGRPLLFETMIFDREHTAKQL